MPDRSFGFTLDCLHTITLYSAPGCCLCEDARRTLEQLRLKQNFDLVEVDITQDDELHRRYLERIPVVCLDNEELFEYHVDELSLLTKLYSAPEQMLETVTDND